MDASASTLIGLLLGAKTFEEAAASVLRVALAIAARALEASRFASRGRVSRAMIHLRPDDGYRGLVVLEAGKDEPSPVEGAEPSLVPSATACRWVAERRAPVAVDVTLLRVEPDAGPPATLGHGHRAGSPTESGFGKQSAERLLARGATHLYALPLRAPGRLAGMLSLEAECPSAAGRPFIWAACKDELQTIADIAAPHLLALPSGGAGAEVADDLLPVIGEQMAGLVRVARVFSRQDETILISGPTGAGKSRLARFCHARSKRSARPFEVLDLIAIPDDLQHAELFGWKKGAFTGAVSDNPGAIARAEGGTLFLDEIDKLSLKAQAGLLRVLEERRYRPLGEGMGERSANVRFLVGTNLRLDEAVRAGKFREDLFYRINVLPLRLPPLDDRADEIPLWADFMATRRHREEAPGGAARLSRAAASVLLGRKWPGNLRQLDNVIRRAYVLALLDRDRDDVPAELVIEASTIDLALGAESGEQDASLLDLLGAAARAFVAEAERRGEEGLDLDLALAFPGLVLGHASRRLGGLEPALRRLGKAVVVDNRNQRKFARRELERVADLYRALGREGASPFADLPIDGKR